MHAKIKVTIRTNEFSQATKEEMWELYRHYYFYDKEYFMARIEKNNYYSFYTVNDKIIGFTGLRINRTKVDGKRQLLVYFGQTVVHHDYRGKSLIPTTGAKLCVKFWKDLLFSNVYFWADALTYKAYLVFAKTVEEMYPSWKRPMSKTVKSIIDHIGGLHYPTSYCCDSGTVQKETILVNDTTTQIPMRFRADDDIRFYQEANPGYQEGHGLITITPMNKRNVKMLLARMVNRIFSFTKREKMTEVKAS